MQKKPSEERIPIGVLPGGSSNAMTAAVINESGLPISQHNAILALCKGNVRNFDLMRIEKEEGDAIYSHLCCSLGLIADVDLESEVLRCLGGVRMDIYAVLRVLQNRRYRVRISFLGKKITHVDQFYQEEEEKQNEEEW